MREYKRNWSKNNPEKVVKYSKNWSKNNPEKRKESANNWYYRNKESENYKSKLRARENKEKIAIRKKHWAKNNPEKIRAQTERRRIRKLQNKEYLITEKEYKKLYLQPCVYCGSKKRITMDHVIPISRGGTHGIGNLVPACLSCNSSKRDKTIMEWRKLER
jgi:5-methylcytosine-specific restriction endonuclease McrA